MQKCSTWMYDLHVLKKMKIRKSCCQTVSYVAFTLFFLYLYFSWIMEVDYNAKIIITFHDFDLEYSKTCAPYDFVKVTDMCNKSKEWSENIATSEKDSEGYCGTKTSSLTVQTRCQKARVQFGSDDSVTKRGFNATFKVIRVPSEFKMYSTIYTALAPPPLPASVHAPSLYPSFSLCILLPLPFLHEFIHHLSVHPCIYIYLSLLSPSIRAFPRSRFLLAPAHRFLPSSVPPTFSFLPQV